MQAAKQPKAALRLCRGQYDVALAALCAAPPSLTADFKMSFRHFEIARSINVNFSFEKALKVLDIPEADYADYEELLNYFYPEVMKAQVL